MILHIDMDAFFASVEQAVNPGLRGKPVIVGTRENKLHTVICAASYEAKALGISSGMPSNEALSRCPDAIFVVADQSKYIWTSEQILELLKGYGFELNYASIDEFQLDIGSYTNPADLAQKIQRQIQENFHITASIGIAKNCILAKLASKLNKPNGVAVLNEESLRQTLAHTPIERLCGVGEKTKEILLNLGIKTCLDLYQKGAQFLKERLGKKGINFYLALHSSEKLASESNEEKPKSIGHSYTLPALIKTPGLIRAWIRLLSEMVGARLRQNQLVSRTVHIWLNGPGIGSFCAQKTFQEPINDSYEIYLKCLKIMAKTLPSIPKIRALGVSCSNLSKINYPPLFNEQRRREALIQALDKINSRYGDWSIYPAVIKRLVR